MRIRWRNFELPSRVHQDEADQSANFGRFVVEPFEAGFGHTIGNGLRRVLLSSIEGCAVKSIRIEGVNHEFDSLDGVFEDVADLVLNLKQLCLKSETDEPVTCSISRTTEGPVTGADVQCPMSVTVVNQDLVLCNLTMDRDLEIEFEVCRGRGYVPAADNRDDEQALGTIPMDAIYSPVKRVRYSIEATRVGKLTNYDRLILEIWTDGTVAPEMALKEAAKIYRKHLNPFLIDRDFSDQHPVLDVAERSVLEEESPETTELQRLLSIPVSELELSVRARNCLDGADMRTMRDIVNMSESEIMNLKNLGKTSLTEIKAKLAEHGLSLGMTID
ncbi:MAG: DNA-directed RNA polymerase subunit alpha [Planctomycetes bacterium]|nr:DNA-directed RNA polymerase subunit alpha [Planctomycetota bacterium]